MDLKFSMPYYSELTKKHGSFNMITALANANPTFTISRPATCVSGMTKVIKTASSLAIPIFATFALANLPTVSADRFTECMDGCDRIEHELMKLICYAWCAIFAS